MECIILAGGLGTRLRGTIGDYPKCMAEVNGKPFLHYVFQYLAQQQCTRAILSLGYKHEVVLDWLQAQDLPFPVDHVIEHEALGTGGGIQLALARAATENVAVLNGDTMFLADLPALEAIHMQHKAAATLALKEMRDFNRYGVVNTDNTQRIISFEEKQPREQGTINGGIYIINKAALQDRSLPEKFSFEKDYLERYVADGRFYGNVSDSYFIDIGIPEDYRQAQDDLKTLFA